MKKLDYIDALRGLAIIGVIVIHISLYGRSNDNHPLFYKIASKGAMGVQLFFMTSAFTLFLSHNSRHKEEVFTLRNFFIRRFFRIAPIYYIGIIYYLFQEGFGPRYWLGDQSHVTVANIISNFIFLHGFYPYWISSVVPGGWSIAIEMSFYAICPILFAKIKNINQAFNMFMVSLVIRLILELFFMNFPLIGSERLWNLFLYFYFPSQLPIFIIGIIMYFVIFNKQGFSDISGKSLFVFCLLCLTHFCMSTISVFPDHILFGMGFLMLGIVLSKYKIGIIVNPLIIYIGKISFSIYLVHFAVLYWLTRLGFIDYTTNDYVNITIRFFVVLILSVMIATVVYKLVEVPFQKIGKKLIDKLEKNHTDAVV